MPAGSNRLALLCGALGALGMPSEANAWPTQPGDLVNPLVQPEACEFCHNFMNADVHEEEPRYSPMRTWRGTMMANAARDPVFWAGVAVADADRPGQTEVCVRCHAPRAFLENNGGATSIDQLTLEQQAGVECEVCHRMMDDGMTPPGNAQYTIDDMFLGSEVARRGPWNYTDGVSLPPHEWIADPFMGDSRLCGTCHDVTTPVERLDDAGVGMGFDFNEQRTYSEWAGSAFAIPGPDARTCQDCHLPAVPDMPGCTSHVNQESHPVGGRRHDLVGANRFMVELIKQEYGSFGANLIGDIYYDTTLEQMDAFLPTAASMDITGPASVDLNVGLGGLDVTVTNDSGHKLPTGYSEGRVMWIEVVAEYAGAVVHSSGLWDQASGMQQDPQLHTYEAIAEEYATGTELHLLLNDHWVVDSRIPPLGSQPNPQTDPVGDRYALQTNGTWPNFDSTSYDFGGAAQVWDDTPGDTTDDVLTVTVRLRYLINTPEYINFLGDAGGMAGADVASLFDLAGGATPVTIVEQVLAIPITDFGSEPPATETGAETDGGVEVGTGDVDGSGDMGASATASTDDTNGAVPETGGGGCSCSTASGGGPVPLTAVGWILLGLTGVGRRRQKSDTGAPVGG